MTKYKVEKSYVSLGKGFVIGLTDKQYKARAHNLEKHKEGYEVINPIQFKTGEIFTVLKGEIGKAVLAKLSSDKKKEEIKEVKDEKKLKSKK